MLNFKKIYEAAINEAEEVNIEALSTEEISKIFNSIMEPGHEEKIYFSKFVKSLSPARSNARAAYVIVGFDENEKEYLVNYFTIKDDEEKGICYSDYSAVPMETFGTLKDAIEYAKGVNESDIFGNPDKNSAGTIIPDIKEDATPEGSPVTATDELWDVYENYFDDVKDMDMKELYQFIKGGSLISAVEDDPEFDANFAKILNKEWHELQEYKKMRLENPEYRIFETIKEDELDDLDAAIKQDLAISRKKVAESSDQKELQEQLVKLVDAEYESLEDFPNHEKLYDYVIGIFPNIEPETVKNVWDIYFKADESETSEKPYDRQYDMEDEPKEDEIPKGWEHVSDIDEENGEPNIIERGDMVWDFKTTKFHNATHAGAAGYNVEDFVFVIRQK